MALLDIRWHPSLRELRIFALLVLGFAGIVSLVAAIRFDALAVAMAVLAAGAFVAVVGCLAPPWIRPVYVAWMAAAFPIGWLVSHAAMAAIFFLVITPIGLMMRACGRDPMQRRFDPAARSYWKRRSPDRDTRSYFRQF
jgi:hypothetical protein